MMTVFLSIIIPSLNEETEIGLCLKKLQRLRDISIRGLGVEVIVADGGSSDHTCELAALYADQVVHSERGRAQQMNAGAGYARGEYLLFLHADTELPSDFSTAWLDGLNWGFFPVKLSGSAWLFRVIERGMNIRSQMFGIGTGDQALFVRRTLFESLNGFANIPLMEDVEFCRRLKKVSQPSFQRGVVTTSSRRWEQRGILRTVLQMWRLRLAYFLGVSPQHLARQYYS
ncbi:MAG: TIGR04283 family arsenosugar biosynthesis glycosyltransferase [Porticoccus sp.]|nr:TIGR04283 family arsenosugar biosynthesis glycosyltransferase [Porticoccus sp.]MBQ0806562.1 TIGR04283 family arsenosugar biosynthesis glycosyltransferase [Porticoccus sp.]